MISPADPATSGAGPSDSSAIPVAVPHDLPATWLAPDRLGYFAARDGAALRYGLWAPPAVSRGTVLILNGRGEFIEKYGMETARELRQRGFAIATCDWRGQGLSARPLDDRQKGHIDSFETYVDDLERFLLHIGAAGLPRPWIVLAHSMGGHATLLHLAIRSSDSPIAGAFLCAPMTGLRREAAIRTALMLLPETAAIEHRFFVYGSGPFRFIGRAFVGNRVTRDERRFRFTEQWFRADPRLAVGGPTIGWLRQALRSIRRMEAPGVLEKVAVPTTILSAGQDQLVDSALHDGVARRIAGATCITYPESRHEIMMETDAVRARFLGDFDRFADRLAP